MLSGKNPYFYWDLATYNSINLEDICFKMCWKTSRQKDSFLSIKYEHVGAEEMHSWESACCAGIRTGVQSPEPMFKI